MPNSETARCPTPDKIAYPSAAHARRANRRRRPPDGIKKSPMWPYNCKCGDWHLSHQTPELRAKIRRYLGYSDAE